MTEQETPTATSPDDLVRRVQELDERLEAVGDSVAREAADELVGTVMDLYGEGLERIFGALADGGSATLAVREQLVNDPVVAGLLLIHGLHPVGLEERVRAALESVRPYLQSHSGDVDLLGLDEGVVRLRLQGSCDGCPSSASTLELAIEQALEEAAPDLAGIEVEGVVEAQPVFHGRQLPLAAAPTSTPGWTPLDGLDVLTPDTMNAALVDGVKLVVANVGGTLLAYRNECAGCGGSLDRGDLEYGILTCPGCGRSFQLPLAGRLLGGEESLQLTPVPLLAENGGVKVAVAA